MKGAEKVLRSSIGNRQSIFMHHRVFPCCGSNIFVRPSSPTALETLNSDIDGARNYHKQKRQFLLS
jgi:hypothetical protein